jgi:putative transposase
MLPCVRWSVADPLRTRRVDALLQERGVAIAHAPGNRWVIKDRPPLEDAWHRRTRPVRVRWRLDETSLTLKGAGRSRSRAVETPGQTSALLRPEPRAQEAA